MTGRTDKRELDEKRRKRDSDFAWLWICRLVVLILIFYWLFQGAEPSERWILLIGLLLGVNEFVRFGIRREKDADEESISFSIRKNKRTTGEDDNSRSESTAISPDWVTMVALGRG